MNGTSDRTVVPGIRRSLSIRLFVALSLMLWFPSEAGAEPECTTALNAALANAVYNVPECCGGACTGSDACTIIVNGEKWVAVDVSKNKMNGFDAATFRKEGSNETIVAFRGTEGWNDAITDLGAVLSPGTGLTQWQYYDALNYYTEMQAKYPEGTISVTGHSLGGSLAMYVGNVTGATTVTFNALGLSPDLADDGSLGSPKNISNYYDTDDPVKCVNEVMGTTVVGDVQVNRGNSAYCDAVKKALGDYQQKMRDPGCGIFCQTQAGVDLGFMLKELGQAMVPAHSMEAMQTAAQSACAATELPRVGDLPKVELPEVPALPTEELPSMPGLPQVGDLPDSELPAVPDLPRPGDLPHAELPTVPDLPHVELPSVPDLPKAELP